MLDGGEDTEEVESNKYQSEKNSAAIDSDNQSPLLKSPSADLTSIRT